MFEVGQKYRIFRNGATEIREKDWVNAVVESYPVVELEKMIKNGELVKR